MGDTHFNHSTQEAKTGGSLRVLDYPGVYNEFYLPGLHRDAVFRKESLEAEYIFLVSEDLKGK